MNERQREVTTDEWTPPGSSKDPAITETARAPLANPSTPPSAGLIAGRYRVLRPLGAGGFGQVFLATDEQLQRQVVVKLLHTSGIEAEGKATAALAEARTVARLQHPNVVQVFDTGRPKRRAQYVALRAPLLSGASTSTMT
jgi:serine/threonine protein kinase